MEAKGKKCDFCGTFMDESEGESWKLVLKYGKLTAKFPDRKEAPHICAECVAKSLEVLGCAVEPVVREGSEEGELDSLILRSYRR